MEEFPKALYREGGEIEHDGANYDLRIVEDAEAEAAAREDGWHDFAAQADEQPRRGRKPKVAVDG